VYREEEGGGVGVVGGAITCVCRDNGNREVGSEVSIGREGGGRGRGAMRLRSY